MSPRLGSTAVFECLVCFYFAGSSFVFVWAGLCGDLRCQINLCVSDTAFVNLRIFYLHELSHVITALVDFVPGRQGERGTDGEHVESRVGHSINFYLRSTVFYVRYRVGQL